MASNLLRVRQLTCTVDLFLLQISIVESLIVVSSEPSLRLLLILLLFLRLAVYLMVAIAVASSIRVVYSRLVLYVSGGAAVMLLEL